MKQWLEKEYPAITKRAKKENAVIYFDDETGMRSDTIRQEKELRSRRKNTALLNRQGNDFP